MRRQPWKITFPVLLCGAFLFCWIDRNRIISLIPFNFVDLPDMLLTALTYALYAFVILLFFLLMALVLQTIGTPRKARKIDRGLVSLFRHDAGYGDWPIYLHCWPMPGSDLFTYTFFSEFVPLESWQEKQKSGKLTSLLGGYIDSIHYGGRDKTNTDYIVVVSGNRARPKERMAIADPLFKEGVES